MMSSNSNNQLDQAIDDSARRYVHTADDYAAYLAGDYEVNFGEREDSWRQHFDNTRAEYNGHIMSMLNRGVRYDDMNIAIVGPGLKPIGREFGNTACRKVFPRVNSMIVADFSPTVVDQSIEQIQKDVNLKGTPVRPMLIDLTDGFSTAYRRMIMQELDGVESEQQLCDIAEGFERMDLEDLRDRLKKRLGEIDYESYENPSQAHSVLPPIFANGGLNEDHTYSLSVDGERLNVQSWFLPMVLAGTGAAAEHLIWDTYNRVTAKDHPGSKAEGDSTDAGRQEMIRQFYDLIARFNTIASTKAISDILEGNPESIVFAVSDVTTDVYDYSMGVLPRLNIDRLRKDLLHFDIQMRQVGESWLWHDEERHHHGVDAFEFFKKVSGSNGGDGPYRVEALPAIDEHVELPDVTDVKSVLPDENETLKSQDTSGQLTQEELAPLVDNDGQEGQTDDSEDSSEVAST